MKKQDPLQYFLPKKETGLDGFADDVDGEVDDRWHKAVQKYVPEVLWNPNHPDRKAKTTKGGEGSGNWGHSGLSGVWGGSSPTKNAKGEIWEARWQFDPVGIGNYSKGQASKIKKILGANVKPIDKKYERPDKKQVKIADYFRDNPKGGLLFELPGHNRSKFVFNKYVLITSNPTKGVQRFTNEFEWKYRATWLGIREVNGVKMGFANGHFTPMLTPQQRKSFTLDDFEKSFFKNFFTDDFFNISPDYLRLVGEIAGEKRKELNLALTLKGGKGSGNWGHQGLAGVHGGSSPTKSTKFQPNTNPIDLQPYVNELYERDAPTYQSPTVALGRQGNVPLFDVDKYFDSQRVADINNRYLKDYIKQVLDEDMSREEFEKYQQSLDWVSKHASALEGTDPVTGYEVDGDFNFDFSPGEEGYADIRMEFDGWIYDKDGNRIGRSVIEFESDSYNGDNHAYINLLAFEHPSTQGGGFGKRYMSHVEDVLYAMGADYIRLEAALTVGGYFWARAGYDFENVRMLDIMTENLGLEWEHRYNQPMPKPILNNIEHSWDIAMTKGPDGFKIGKHVMLGSHWMGVKPNPDYGWDDDGGYEIGKEYYEG